MTMKGKLALGVSILVAMNAAMGVIGLLYLDGTARVVTVALSLITVLIVLGLWFMTVRAVAEPLEYAVRVAHHVASGDLTTAIQADGSGEFGKLLAGMKSMIENLRRMVSNIRVSADAIYTSASEVASGNANLSQRTEEQASTLEQTASSMEQLTEAVRANTESARKANALSKSANAVAAQGGQVVSEVVVTMNQIQESSRKISDIISVIDSIAFQTNILALNAAVEAARAGEQGRGFAVVASEVRSLAQRSADAAKEIKALIGNSVERVDEGTRLVESAGKTMSEIVESVARVTAIIDQIATASNDQSGGIEQVNQAIMQMDHVVQQGRADVQARVHKLMQTILDRYKTGINVVSVTMQNAQPPEQVQAAFEDAVKAKQDLERQKNEGQAYANDVIPKARGTASRLLQEAQGYKLRVENEAQGNVSRFNQIFAQYQKAPEVTRQRMYLDAQEQIMSNVSKVIVDQKNGNNLLYLPLDKLMAVAGANAPAAASPAPASAAPVINVSPTTDSRSRDDVRVREREGR